MKEQYLTALEWLSHYPLLESAVGLSLLLLGAWLADLLVRRIMVRGLYRLMDASAWSTNPDLSDSKIIARLAHVVPPLLISSCIQQIPHLPQPLITVVENLCNAFIVLTLALAVSSLLDLLNALYLRRPDAHLKPIKSYLQLLKIAVYAIGLILMVSNLIDRSPLILLSGLGAMAAVLMLIFQDTLLSFVASMQINSSRLLRVGDWVEMQQLNADGEVIDIALHTVKIQNWDKTITNVPTKRFISDPFKNWQAMREGGGRRIKRSLFLDQQSVHFLDAEERRRLHRFSLLKDYLGDKERDIEAWNAQLAERGQEPVNTRRTTNLGSFRAYAERYVRSHPGVHQGMTLMVRQMAPTPEGLPMEIYCFTNTVAWVGYENTQADIFDHLLAILPEFGLRIFQSPSGSDLRARAQPPDTAE